MNTNDMYSREKVGRMKQEEIRRDVETARMFPLSLGAAYATLLVVASALGLRLPL
jgi:hypothetical protein